MEIDLQALRAEFPRDVVSWRSQSLAKVDETAKTSRALALAYIDARDVMKRLDDVCGPANWEDAYEIVGKTVLCTIRIRINGEWVSKTDGAGETQVEAEKGSISDAFKRAAVKWGIGRYLYDVATPWVPCEVYKNAQGKWLFSKFTKDPWSIVKAPAPAKPESTPTPNPAPEPTLEEKKAEQRKKAEKTRDEFSERMKTIDAVNYAALKLNEPAHKNFRIIRDLYSDLYEEMTAVSDAAALRLGQQKMILGESNVGI